MSYPYSTEILADSPSTYLKFDEEDGALAYVDSSAHERDIDVIVDPGAVDDGMLSWSSHSRMSSSGIPLAYTATNISGLAFETWLKASDLGDYVLAETPSLGAGVEALVVVSESPSTAGERVLKFGLGVGSWSIDVSDTHQHMFVHSDDISDVFDGRWHHVVCAWSGTSGFPWNASDLLIMVDGIRRDQASTRSTYAGVGGNAPITLSGPLHVTGPATGTNASLASFDNLAVYDTGLTESTIVAHFNSAAIMEMVQELDSVPEAVPYTGGELLPAQEIDSAEPLKHSSHSFAIEGSSSVSVAAQSPDYLLGRTVLPLEGSVAVNIVGATLETNEPNAAGYLGTTWFEIPFSPDDMQQARITLSSPTSTGKVSVYKQPSLDEIPDVDDIDSDDEVDPSVEEPTFSGLVLTQSASSDQIVTLDQNYGSSYFIQVGLLTGTGDDFVLSWGDASPPPGGSFDTSMIVSGDTGRLTLDTTNAWLENFEPNSPDIVETRSLWIGWEAPEGISTPMNFTVTSDTGQPFAVEVYSGETLTSLSQLSSGLSVDGSSLTLTVIPTELVMYHVRIAAVGDGRSYTITWSPPVEDLPAVEPVSHMRVTVHAGVRGWTAAGVVYPANALITEIPNRVGAQFQEALNVPGSGTLTMMQNDPIIRAYNPVDWPEQTNGSWSASTQSTWDNDPYQLLRFGNIVKFWMYNSSLEKEVCVSAFIIKARDINIVGSGEEADRTITVSGPSVHQLLADFLVMHPNKSTKNVEMRNFTWAAVANTSSDLWQNNGWLDAGRGSATAKGNRIWNHPTNSRRFTDPPGWRKKKNQKASQRPKYALVKKGKWPRGKKTNARWIWLNANRSTNQNTSFPVNTIKMKNSDGTYGSPVHYYRAKTFNISKSAYHRFSVYCDTYYQVWVDGQLIMSGDGRENFTRFAQKSIHLHKTVKGTLEHTVAVYVKDNLSQSEYDHNDALLLTVQRLNKKGNPETTVLDSNTGSWHAWHGMDPPSWSRAMILRTAILDARVRGNDSAKALTIASNFGQKSAEGSDWWDAKSFSMQVQVGTSALDLQAKFSETNRFDVYVDPDTLQIYAYQSRQLGASSKWNRYMAGNVALVPGHNLINWTVSERDEIKNRLLTKYEGGYVYVTAESAGTYNSASDYGAREGYLELGGLTSANAAIATSRSLMSWTASPTISGGSDEVVGHFNEEYSGSVIPVAGAVPFLDWKVGDYVSAPEGNGTLSVHRVLSLTCTEDSNGLLTFDPELQGM